MHQWTLEEDAAAPFFRQAVELGVTFRHPANVYQGGTSEEFMGRAMRRFSRREDVVVLATQVHGRCTTAPAAGAGYPGLTAVVGLEGADTTAQR